MDAIEELPQNRSRRDLQLLSAAVDRLRSTVDDGGLDELDDPGLLTLMQDFEQLRRRLSTIDHQLLNACERRRVADTTGHGRLARMVESLLRLSPGEASRRVRAAAACGPRTSMTGEALEPVRPILAAAQAAGDVSPEQVHLIERALDPYDRPGFDPADVEAGERLLTTHALTFGPRELGLLADEVTSAIDPDGSLPDDELNADRRHLNLRPTRDGAYAGEFRLTAGLGAKLVAVLDPLARPRLTTVTTEDGSVTNDLDPRSRPQRMHDALEDVCDRILRSGTLPDAGGTPATVIVTMDVDDLRHRTGTGVTSDGTVLTIAEILRLAGEADVIPTVCTAAGAVLDLGRSRRIASPSQTLGLIARDQGCSFPGCSHPPDYCERHHIVAWADGGLTKLDNLTLLCRYHHRYFADRGWSCRIDHDSLPAWTPPRWLDREQRPLVNHRILSRRLVRQSRPLLDAARPEPPSGADLGRSSQRVRG